MSTENTTTPAAKQTLEDNARKFTLAGLDPAFLQEHEASSYILTTDWLETNEDNETKLAYKKFPDGTVQILHIAKVTKNGSRTSEKEKITEERYQELLHSSILHLEKVRHEFEYTQNDVTFSIKYDEFTNSPLRILEVDAHSDEERAAFVPGEFPTELIEVTGDLRYYGYRVASVV